MLMIAKLSAWSINYYNDTARAAVDAQKAGGGLGEYYSEHDTRTPVWLCAGDTRRAAELVGLSDRERVGGGADPDVVENWLFGGEAPNGASGRGFRNGSVHGFDLTFCAPKSVSLIRAIRADDVADKAIADAHATAIAEAMEYLATHAGYTRVHNPATGEKDLVRLPGLVAIAYQHETSRTGDPHLHTHVIVPNRQARGDGRLVSIDGTSLYHEAKAAGVIYQATLRRELHRSLGYEWLPVDPSTGMAEVAGIDPNSIAAWSQRSSQLREWAAGNLEVNESREPTASQLAAAQKATRPGKPEQLGWMELRAGWRADERGLGIDSAPHRRARRDRLVASGPRFDRHRIADAAATIEKAAFTRADLIEVIGAQLPVDTARSPRELVEEAVDEIAVRLTAPREAHQREGHERFTLDLILAEEAAVLDLVDAQDPRSILWGLPDDIDGLSPDQQRAVVNIAVSPWLVQPLSAPAGAGKTTSMRALAAMARRRRDSRVIVLAPTGNAVDVAVLEGAGDVGYTIAKALQDIENGRLTLDPRDLVIVDEAGMVGTDDLCRLLTTTTSAGIKTVLVGDQHQLAPVKARGGMFAQLCTDLPWTQKLSEVWRMRDPQERSASLALRDGGPAPVRRAIEWYRKNDRLQAGDEIAMASAALAAYRRDIAAGKDSLLVCDTKEMADALNHRIHNETIDPQAPTVTAARGHQIGVGDLIISRRNDPTISVLHPTEKTGHADPVRNGNRWRVYAIDPDNHRIAARRINDGARTVFTGDYLRDHITHGYAITVHSAQGATTDTTHAVLRENTTRALFYVAMSRGRNANTAYLTEQLGGDKQTSHHSQVELGNASPDTSRHAAQLVRGVVANDREQPRTAHYIAAQTPGDSAGSDPVSALQSRRLRQITDRKTALQDWQRGHSGVTDKVRRGKSQSWQAGVEGGVEL
ncbi:MobF family relaxase [Mycolicibacterium rhodesiae]|uniref:AAA family ATPase n=1 Tax=Mycolicibacterium rhodesiae TaxID=36814 RepID=A0A1X0IPW5_MYCRH|nr:MobF family relaxase [Mycolicibacterium rhodesiae]MCV7348378.1 relaxase domain-containing protein [Mycolicibacterium rhodesiae]ORB50494.1 AAA family ATPase [Mycolicibacterium rhodesiae]